jgi:hypothetical protein
MSAFIWTGQGETLRAFDWRRGDPRARPRASTRTRAPFRFLGWLALVLTVAVPAAGPALGQGYALGPGGIISAGGSSPTGGLGLGAIPTAIAGTAVGDPGVHGVPQTIVVTASSISLIAPPDSADYGTDVPVAADVRTPFGTPDVSLSYRPGGQGSYQPLLMSLRVGSYGAEIPGGDVSERGLEYYVRATAGAVSLVEPARDTRANPGAVEVVLKNFGARGALATASRTFRMLSFGINLGVQNTGDLLEHNLGAQDIKAWRLGRWDPVDTTYREYTRGTPVGTYVPGEAYWLITEGARTLSLSGRSQPRPASGRRSVTLKPGWNQIANPFAFPVSLNEVTFTVGGVEYDLVEAVDSSWIETSPLHEWTGSTYANSGRTLAPWTGYFVANTHAQAKDILLNIPYSEAPAPVSREAETAATDSPWLLSLGAGDEAGRQATVQLGLAERASAGLDALDALMCPAPPGEWLELASVNDRLAPHVGRMSRDVRPLAPDSGATWVLRVKSLARGPIRIRAALQGEPPAGMKVQLFDPDAKRRANLLAGEDYELLARVPGEELRLVVVTGTDSYVEAARSRSAGQAFDLALRPVAPNPATLPLFVQFTLPQGAPVKLEIFDVTGRLVERLASGFRPAGLHTLRWDGRSASRNPASAGMYYARLETGGHVRNRKFVLLK